MLRLQLPAIDQNVATAVEYELELLLSPLVHCQLFQGQPDLRIYISSPIQKEALEALKQLARGLYLYIIE
jgi:hypothetical protein